MKKPKKKKKYKTKRFSDAISFLEAEEKNISMRLDLPRMAGESAHKHAERVVSSMIHARVITGAIEFLKAAQL